MKIRKGDTVIIIAGKERGKTGTIEAVFPSLNRAVITGLNRYKKHVKPSAKYPNGGIQEFSRSIHLSNLMLLDSETKKPTRVGYQVTDGTKVRITRLNQKPL